MINITVGQLLPPASEHGRVRSSCHPGRHEAVRAETTTSTSPLYLMHPELIDPEVAAKYKLLTETQHGSHHV